MEPAARAVTKSSVTTWPPRATLTSQACLGRAINSAALMIPTVSLVRARARTSTSVTGRTSWRRATGIVRLAPGNGWSERRMTVTSHSKGASNGIRWLVMPPPPRTVTRLPASIRPTGPDHEDARAYPWRCFCPLRIMAKAISATAGAYTPFPQVHVQRSSRWCANGSIPA